MLSEREEIAQKQNSIFCNRQLCAQIVKISIQEIPQNERKVRKNPTVLQRGRSACLKVTPVCSISVSVI